MEQVRCKIGESWDVLCTITDENNAVVDLSGYSATYGLKKQPDETTDYVISATALTVYSGTSGTASGTISGTIPPSATELIPARSYYEEIELTNGTILKKFQRIRIVEARVITS